MADEVDEYELEKLRAEILQERQMKEMLDQSAKELRITVEELEKRYEAIENEGNEWKTRFETQEEMNQQLERQIIMLQDKIEEAKRNLKDAGKTPRDAKSFDDLSDANPAMVKTMEKEKALLYNQLRDLEWRLDQESKAYHKANDERKQYVLEINTTKGNIDGNKARQRAAVGVQQREADELSRSPRLMGPSRLGDRSRRSSYSYSISNMGSRVPSLSNIPEDQRILDPRKGPIKKTAAVKNLPSLDLHET
ncbi:coiled-coil domain-containing protein 169-like isoform X7 [Dreissena polymorpha]|uniref:coiled-coil domain-containing protein 169-like isoform X7 n=1 Tax=Dreissena polymorpha TaxID=45954 RepID=UPI00226557D7|nr:coiled-coil domain-containing protein 169-like isoform X7 [Dreissena polymorpha]